MPSLYQILKVPREASSEEIQKSYQRFSEHYSSDKDPDHEKEFNKIREAFNILSNPKKRSDYDKLAYLDKNQLIAKGRHDINIAHQICDDESLMQKVGPGIYHLGIAHENIALKILTTEILRRYITLEREGMEGIVWTHFLSQLVLQHQSVCEHIILIPEFRNGLSGEMIHDIIKKFPALLNRLPTILNNRLTFYQVQKKLVESNDVSESEFSTFIETILQYPIDAALLSELCVKHITIAEYVFHEEKLWSHLMLQYMRAVGVAHEKIAKRIIKYREYYRLLLIDGFIPHWVHKKSCDHDLFPIVFEHESACEILLRDTELCGFIRYESFLALKAKFPEIFKRLSNDYIEQKLEFYRVLDNFLHGRMDLDAGLQIFKNAVARWDIDPDKIMEIALKFSMVAEWLCDQMYFINKLGRNNIVFLATTHENVAIKILKNKILYINSFVGIIYDLFQKLALTFESACVIILQDAELSEKISGDDLFVLSGKWGIKISQIIEKNPILFMRLREYMLPGFSNRQAQLKDQREVVATAQENEAEILYQLGRSYKLFGTAECDDLAREYYQKAALKEHGKALEALIALVGENKSEYYLNILFIVSNPQSKLYDEKRADWFLRKVIANRSIIEIIHLLGHPKLRQSFARQLAILENLAKQDKDACITILKDDVFSCTLTPELLYQLILKYGIDIFIIIDAQPGLRARLTEYLLHEICKQSAPRKIDTDDNIATQLYAIGDAFAKLPEPVITVAKYCFYQSAVRGSREALNRCLEWRAEWPVVENIVLKINFEFNNLRVAFIYADAAHPFYDPAAAKTHFSIAAEERSKCYTQHDVGSIARCFIRYVDIATAYSNAEQIVGAKRKPPDVDAIISIASHYYGEEELLKQIVLLYRKNNRLKVCTEYLYKAALRGYRWAFDEWPRIQMDDDIINQYRIFLVALDPRSELSNLDFTLRFASFFNKITYVDAAKQLSIYLQDCANLARARNSAADEEKDMTFVVMVAQESNKNLDESFLFCHMGFVYEELNNLRLAKRYYYEAAAKGHRRALQEFERVSASTVPDNFTQLSIAFIYADHKNISHYVNKARQIFSALKEIQAKEIFNALCHYLRTRECHKLFRKEDVFWLTDYEYIQSILAIIEKEIPVVILQDVYHRLGLLCEKEITENHFEKTEEDYYIKAFVEYYSKGGALGMKELLRYASDNDHHVPMLKLASIFANASGRFYNEEQAKFWFCTAAQKGSIEAGYHLIKYVRIDINLLLRTGGGHATNEIEPTCLESLMQSMIKLVDIKNAQNITYYVICLFYIGYLCHIDDEIYKYSSTLAYELDERLRSLLILWDENLRSSDLFHPLLLKSDNGYNISNISNAELKFFYCNIRLLLCVMLLPVSIMRIRFDLYKELKKAFRRDEYHVLIQNVIPEIVHRHQIQIKRLCEIADQEKELNKILLLLDKHNKQLMNNITLSQKKNDPEQADVYIKRSCAVQSLLSDLSKACTRYYTQDFSLPDVHPDPSNLRCELNSIITRHLVDRNSGLTQHGHWIAGEISRLGDSLYLMFSPSRLTQGQFVHNEKVANSTVNLIKENINTALDKLLGPVSKELSPDKENEGTELIEMKYAEGSAPRRT